MCVVYVLVIKEHWVCNQTLEHFRRMKNVVFIANTWGMDMYMQSNNYRNRKEKEWCVAAEIEG